MGNQNVILKHKLAVALSLHEPIASLVLKELLDPRECHREPARGLVDADVTHFFSLKVHIIC